MSAFRLTPREWEVLRLIVQDHRDSERETESEVGVRVAESILAKIDARSVRKEKT